MYSLALLSCLDRPSGPHHLPTASKDGFPESSGVPGVSPKHCPGLPGRYPGGARRARSPSPRVPATPTLSSWALPRSAGRVPEPGAADTAGRRRLQAGSVRTAASGRPPGSRLLVPPRGPKTVGAAAPVAAAACSWRARAATATSAASSTSTAGCLVLPRRERWTPLRPPSHPPQREPQQLQRPGPTRPDPRSQDRRTRRFLLRRKIRPDLSPHPLSPVSRRLMALVRRREGAPAKRAWVGMVVQFYITIRNEQEFQLLHILTNTCLFQSFKSSHSNRCFKNSRVHHKG
ncbi:uncharacterized protein DKFZp434B061-like [Lepus europaeus]|uniref:uncharacterized protein DKFZp434B061-like n=1 Tax=Lepus europaeus TaxID=9983 RepID=UPI002B47BA0F|nr:uncharacterized protein DKFZp434B061-like [Lepus europaeus]